jgi:phosphatidylglycerophosphate synthase
MSERKVTCYSEGEQRAMDASQRWRGRFFEPFLSGCATLGIRPGHLTALSLVMGAAFCPVFFWSVPGALVLLALHVLLDGLDGPLARHLGTASNRGSFTDSTADQIVVALTTITLIHAGHVSAIAGGLYCFLYTVVVVFAMVRNALNVPYSWVVRPRFAVYMWFIVELYAWPGSLTWVLWIFSALLGLKMATGFFSIRRSM